MRYVSINAGKSEHLGKFEKDIVHLSPEPIARENNGRLKSLDYTRSWAENVM